MKSRIEVVVCLILLTGMLSSCFRSAPPQPQAIEEISPQSILLTKPVNGGELPIGTDISVTFNEAMNTTSVERAVSIFPGVYDPSKNPATYTTLQLTSMCNGKWRVRNPNAVAISFTWDIYNTTTKGLGVVPANSDVFFYTPIGSNTVRVFVGTKQQQVKATNTTTCTGQPFTFSWSADSRTVSFKPTDALIDGKAYTVVISTAVRNVNNQVNQTAGYAFGVRVEDYNKYIDPGIQGVEREVMLRALVNIPKQNRNNVIFRDTDGKFYTNRESLKYWTTGEWQNQSGTTSNISSPSTVVTHSSAASNSSFTELDSAFVGVKTATPNFVGRIELQPLGSDDLTTAIDPVSLGWSTCKADNGPYVSGIAKEVADPTFPQDVKTKLIDPSNPSGYAAIRYMEMDITLPPDPTLYDPTSQMRENPASYGWQLCRDSRREGDGTIPGNENFRPGIPDEVQQSTGETVYHYPGFWLPNGNKFEGGLKWNCDQKKWSLFYADPELPTLNDNPPPGLIGADNRVPRWGTPEQKVRFSMSYTTAVVGGKTVVSSISYTVKALPNEKLTTPPDNNNVVNQYDEITFSYAPRLPDAEIGGAQDVQDIVWAFSYGNAQSGAKPPIAPLATGSTAFGFKVENIKVAACPEAECERIDWDLYNSAMSVAPLCETAYATASKEGNAITIGLAACTNKITSGDDAGQCDSDSDGIADYRERADGTNPFDANDPGVPVGGSITDFYSDQLSFTARISPTNPDAKYDVQWIGFTNGGPGTLRYDITENIPWLEVLGPTSDTLPEGEEAGIQIRATCTEIGNFDGSFTVEGAGQTFTVQVTLECTESIYIYAMSVDKTVIGQGDEIRLTLQTSGDPTDKVVWSTTASGGNVNQESINTFVYKLYQDSPRFLQQNVLTVANIDDPTNTFSVTLTECPGVVDEDAWYCPIVALTGAVRNPKLTDNNEIYVPNSLFNKVNVWTRGTNYGLNVNNDDDLVFPNNQGQFLVYTYTRNQPDMVKVYQRTNAQIRLVNSWPMLAPDGGTPRPIAFNDLGHVLAKKNDGTGGPGSGVRYSATRWKDGTYEEYSRFYVSTNYFNYEDYANNVGDFFFTTRECDEDSCSNPGSVLWAEDGEEILLDDMFPGAVNDNRDYLAHPRAGGVYSSIHGLICEGVECGAIGITNAGDALFINKDSNNKTRTFIRLRDGASNLSLESLLDPDFADTLTTPYAINNQGSIFINSSSGKKYLLVPMPGKPNNPN